MPKLNIIINNLKTQQPIFAYFDENDKRIIVDTEVRCITDNSISFSIQESIRLNIPETVFDKFRKMITWWLAFIITSILLLYVLYIF